MKRTIISALVAGLVMFAASAADNYTVKSVSGKVQYEENGTWKTVTKGMELPSNANVTVGVGANLIVNKAGEKKDVRIKSNSKGTIDSFASASSGGIKVGGAAEKNTTAKAKNAGDKGVATASSRAADVKKDMEFAEDEEPLSE
ncbi:MAG: hypothetical protein IJ717_03995 [Treponema sp.]|nr:hypothetical protein [Treponema sp.]MBR1615699.1 hypothetical protein [Treponema sp.]MBR1714092.1 hypothetical protein [Treponema sp.]